MIKIENKLFLLLAFLMASVVALSNYLVQFPINYFGLKNLLTYGAFSYPIAFLITDLANRSYGKNINLHVSNAALITVDFKGGLDNFLKTVKTHKLSKKAKELKSQIITKT